MTKKEREKRIKTLKEEREKLQEYCDANWEQIKFYKHIETTPEYLLDFDMEYRSQIADIDNEIYLLKIGEEEQEDEQEYWF